MAFRKYNFIGFDNRVEFENKVREDLKEVEIMVATDQPAFDPTLRQDTDFHPLVTRTYRKRKTGLWSYEFVRIK